MTIEECLTADGSIVYRNTGTSMLPFIKEGRDLIYITKLGGRPLRKYDAVLFKRPGVRGRDEYVLHRIVKTGLPEADAAGTAREAYLIIGDNLFQKEIVGKEQILGLLEEIRRGGRTIRCESFGFRLSVRIWWLLYPFRYVWTGAGARLKRFCGKHLTGQKKTIPE